MSTQDEKRIEFLRDEIRLHDRKYYVEAAPVITDREYDLLLAELTQLEQQHPELVTPDSPTQRIGDQPVPELVQVAHRLPMLSIENSYDPAEVRAFAERTRKVLEDEPVEWVVELKVDGVAVSVLYEGGRLIRGVTRGNGQVGDDITHTLRTALGVPLRLYGDYPPVLEVRGEVYITNDDLVTINERQQARGEKVFANTRNLAAGALRQLDPRSASEKMLRLLVHGVG
jgi:DNA ligase (NAD+)